MSQKKIFLSAYIDGNLGDDLFIVVICQRYPQTTFYLCGNQKYKHLFAHIKNLVYKSCDTMMIRAINKGCRLAKIPLSPHWFYPKADAMVKIGGSLFMQLPHWRDIHAENCQLMEKHPKNFLLGANFGPYHDQEFLDTYREFFKNFEDICFRDSYSKNLFSDLAHVRHADDVVFQLHAPKGETKNHYVISVIHCKNRKSLKEYHQAYINKLREIITEIVKTGAEVILMGFCTTEKDHETLDEIYTGLSEHEKERTQLYNHNNIQVSLELIASAKGVIATRFHAMILGLLWEKPIIPILYSEKMRNILTDIKYDGPHYDLQDAHSIDPKTCVDFLTKGCTFSAKPMIKNSDKQFTALDSFLRA